jgi:predicted MFS family arabinose efflux permease
MVPVGDLTDRRRLIALHLLLVAGGLTTVAVAPSSFVALVGLAVAGFFAVVVQTTVAYAAALSLPAERGRDLGIVTSGVVLGILGSRVLAGVIADAWGWRTVYAVLAAATALVALAAVRWLPIDRRTATGSYRGTVSAFAGLFRQPLLWSRGLIAFFAFASFGTLWSGLTLPLSDGPRHLSGAQVGLFGLAGLVGALGATRAGRWADAGWATRTTGTALTLLALSWLAIARLPTSLPLLILGVVVLDFAVQAVQVSNQHTLTAAQPDRPATTIGAYMVFYSLGSALGAAGTSASYATHGWTGSTILGGGFALAGLVVWALSALRAPGETRTHTGTDLNRMPLPIGLRALRQILGFAPAAGEHRVNSSRCPANPTD